jgi:GT2 family glycosyltransferase/SAM-dependent methyltransferase/glycosyltransferase involved in cell wall biosynthesis
MTQYHLDTANNYWLREGFGGIAYSDGADFESGLLASLRTAKDKSVFSPELSGLMRDWRSEYHLTPLRHCLMRPVPIQPGDRVLELGCGCGAITRYLGELGAEVTAVEGGAPRAAIAAERCSDLKNVKVVLDDLVLFESEELFDWVTLIGVLEYSPAFVSGEDPTLAYLQQALRYLKPGGKLVLAIENQLGLKYFNGCGEDHQGTPFFGVNGLYGPGTAVTFGRNRLEEQLRKAGCQSVEFSYAFPDYKLPTVIVRDEAFHTDGMAVSDMLLRMESRDYGNRPFRLFSEQLASNTLEDNQLLQHFANSFLVIASPAPQAPRDQDPLGWCFSVSRQDEFRTQTTFTKTADKKIVVDKIRLRNPSLSELTHPAADWLHHRTGRSDYLFGKLNAWPILKAKLLKDPLNQLTEAFLPFAEELLHHAQPAEGEDNQSLEAWLAPGSLIDFTPFNLVRTKEGLQPIDDEWVIEGAIPVGWILCRGIVQTISHGLGSHRLADISLQSLVSSIVIALKLTYREESIDDWLELEQHFLQLATGRHFSLLSRTAPLSSLSPWRILDPDRLPAAPTTDATQTSERPSIDEQYNQWQAGRKIQASDGGILGQCMVEEWKNQPLFHLVVRVKPGATPLLADTLESLNYQIYNRWTLDIIATIPCPDPSLMQIQGVSWHQLPETGSAKNFIDPLIAARGADWVFDVPAGVQLDPLCLWRVAHQSNTTPDAAAYYLDDDLSVGGFRKSPRFKPDTNPEWFRSMDLAGPLFIRRSVLREIGGTSLSDDAQWYETLLRLLAARSPQEIGHISGPLLSYPEYPGTETEEATYHRLLAEHLQQQGRPAEILPVSKGKWAARYALASTPLVSIVISTQDHLEYLDPCLKAVVSMTTYPNYEILVIDNASSDPELTQWLDDFASNPAHHTRVLRQETPTENHSRLNNLAVKQAQGDFLLFLNNDSLILQGEWLTDLMRLVQFPEVAGATARIIRAGEGTVVHAGYTLGLAPLAGSIYAGEANITDEGYLGCLHANRQISAMALNCALIRRSDYLAAGGMDEAALPNHQNDIDLSLKLTAEGKRLMLAATVAAASYGGMKRSPLVPLPELIGKEMLAEAESSEVVQKRWLDKLGHDPFWNTSLSLETTMPSLELETQPLWDMLPVQLPKILARPVSNVQGDYRILSPLNALRRAGKVLPCIYTQHQSKARELTPIEIARLAPDSIIAQNYLGEFRLRGLAQWRRMLPNAFIIYALDDLATRMPAKSSLRKGIPADTRTRLQYALSHCDRLVVSTEYLADAYGRYCKDVIVVPNRLERDRWMSLKTQRGLSSRPRIGWAGGTGHQGDLELLKPVIEATRDRTDWIFFGMCPDELKHLVVESHDFVSFNHYPEKIAGLNLDLAVAPLEDIPFNHGKSNLRLLEYGALGLPVVCSDVTPYRNSPACRVANTPKAWIEAIMDRLDQPQAAAEEGKAMRAWVEQHFIVEDHLDDWLQAHLPG